jgi:hypothetical protein
VTFGFHKREEYLHQRSNYQNLKKNSAETGSISNSSTPEWIRNRCYVKYNTWLGDKQCLQNRGPKFVKAYNYQRLLQGHNRLLLKKAKFKTVGWVSKNPYRRIHKSNAIARKYTGTGEMC